MKIYDERLHPEVIRCLRSGGVVVLRTDTLYGVVASVLSQAAVERVYRLRHRNAKKACIVLVASESHLPTPPPIYAEQVLAHAWPGPVTVILPVDNVVPEWLHRGLKSLAFRVPADPELRELLLKTGPLIAPSANPEGEPPAETIEEAVDYFGESVDVYVNNGHVKQGEPSRLIKPLPDGTIERLR
ncbi:MAG TPA: L-threonylcarbamoyladenylate synthase [Candidatus Saccharimonadales bacterium]